MTILDLIWSSDYPKKTILEKLICHQLGISKEKLFTHGDEEISSVDLKRIQQAYNAYIIEKQPLEYIKGYVEFAWLKFLVNKHTLIPRPETEYMIEAVREEIEKRYKSSEKRVQKKELLSLLDIWTWCWVLWLSTLSHCWAYISQAIFTDLSLDALGVAKKNKEYLFSEVWSLTSSVSFVQSDLLNHTDIETVFSAWNNILLVANLPYIPDGLFDENTDETVKKREPRMAFVWWDDGLDLYRIMFDQLLQIIWWTSTWPLMFLEMMTWQVDILRKEYPLIEFEEVKTFHFNIRIVKAWIT